MTQNTTSAVLEGLPLDFLGEIATSIPNGFLQRLRILENLKEIRFSD